MPRLSFLAKEERGLTLVEVLVSVTLLVLMSMSFAPALMFVLETAERNRIRTTATVLANEVIEELRGKSFDEIVIDESNLVGEKVEERAVDGHDYLVKTIIYWLELDEIGEPNWDYKGITVEVSPIGSYTGKGPAVTLETAVSREFGTPFLGGIGIRVHAYRGWQTGEREPSPDLWIKVTQGAKQERHLIKNGKVLILGFAEGKCTIAPEVPSGFMIRPDSVLEMDLAKGSNDLELYLEKPCNLKVNINLKDPEGQPLQLAGVATLGLPFLGQDGEPLTIDKNFTGSGTVSFENLWPVGEGYIGSYDLTVTAGEYRFAMSEVDDDERPWDGKFGGPDKSVTITVSPVKPEPPEEEDENGEEPGDPENGTD